MLKLVGLILEFMPLIFGVGFLAPLIAQVIERAGWTLPFGIAPLAAGLVMAVAHTAWRLQLERDPAPGEVLATLNRVLCRLGSCRTSGPRQFFAGVSLLLQPDGSFVAAVAGHPRMNDRSSLIVGTRQSSYPPSDSPSQYAIASDQFLSVSSGGSCQQRPVVASSPPPAHVLASASESASSSASASASGLLGTQTPW